MAKKCWNTDNVEVGWLTREYDDPQVEDLHLNMTDLFPDFLDMDEVECNVILNGVKQKIADTIARSKEEALTEAEKREAQLTLWERLTKDREWNLPKVGGTRGPSVTLTNLIPAINEFLKMGFTVEKIAGLISKPVDLVQRYVDEAKVDEVDLTSPELDGPYEDKTEE